MSLDGTVLYALVSELQSLVGAKISKIHQPGESELVWQLRAHGQNVKLLLSAHPEHARVHVTERSFENPPEPPMFCMLLRKYLEQATIVAVQQVEMERIIHIELRHLDDLGDVRRKRLIVELMGRHSNLILFDPERNVIIDGIRHVTPSISSYRIVMPGAAYVPPPAQHKLNVLETDDLSAPFQAYQGFSPLLIKQLSADSRPSVEVLHDFREQLRARRWRAQIAVERSASAIQQKQIFHIVDLTALPDYEVRHTFTSVSECLEAYFGERAERARYRQRANDLHRLAHNELAKASGKRTKLSETLTEAARADEFRICGELLTASLHTLRRGERTAKVINYYDEQQALLDIPLDPLLTPAENAQRYFRKYSKLKNSVAVVQAQIVQCETEITYFTGVLQQLDVAGAAELDEIREEFVELGYLRNRQKRTKKTKMPNKPNVTVYRASDGTLIWVGKNNKQNDYVTQKLARNHDTWLHTKDIPGSHVVIHSADVSPQTLIEAAHLAAYFSQARASSQVPVDYTLVRHVHKPSGAKPGFVIYEQQKTVYVTPDESVVQSLRAE